jgi:hypothetical protein
MSNTATEGTRAGDASSFIGEVGLDGDVDGSAESSFEQVKHMRGMPAPSSADTTEFEQSGS